MRKTLSVVVLVLIFCCPVTAGIIHNPAPEAEPTQSSSAQEATADGETPDDVTGTLTQMMLTLLASALS